LIFCTFLFSVDENHKENDLKSRNIAQGKS